MGYELWVLSHESQVTGLESCVMGLLNKATTFGFDSLLS